MLSTEYPYVAGVDTSTQSCKVVIIDPKTNAVLREGKANHPEGTEVDPQAWWEAFLAATKQAGGFADVAALSVGGQQHGLVCLDKNGEVIRPALLWNDTRSAQAAEELITQAGQGNYETGKAWWADNTGTVPVASITVTKIRWLATHEPENITRLAAICLPHDWLTWKISGSNNLHDLVTDRSDASGTGYVDRNTGSYRYDILATAINISQEQAEKLILPRILNPWESVLHADPKRGWEHMILGPGCGDNAGAALGVNIQPGQALLSLGTSGVVAAVSSHSVADSSGMVAGFADATGNWLPLACTLNASRIIDAMARVINADYKEFDQLALSVPNTAGLTIIPYFEGERTPNLPDATAELTGLTLANAQREYVARATVEGLLTLMRGALDAVRDLNVRIDRVLVVGGGAKSSAIQQLAAQFLDAEVEFPPPGEYVALGAAQQAYRVIKNYN